MKRLIFFVYLSVASTFLFSQAENCHLNIGMNLAGPVDWGSEWPFVNIMKYGRTWETTNAYWVGGGQNLWNTELISYFEFDEQGYPLEVPLTINHPNADVEQVIRSVWANTNALPEGTYVILYEGTGVIETLFDAEIISQTPGRIEVQVTHGGEIMGLQIMESQLGDHIRNIRFLLPGTEETYQENPWSDSWFEKLTPFKSLRFMDWGHTNNSTLAQWEDRPQIDDYTYTPQGIPYEYWIEACNQLEADAWVCVPHLADANYVTQLATMFRDQLDPNLKIYVEYSNELWNWLFQQAQWGESQLDQSIPWPERLAPRIAEIMQIWTDVFGPESDRLVRVVAGQHGWFDITDRIYGQMAADGNDHLVDAISPAGYISIDAAQLANLGAAATAQDVINGASAFTFDPNEWAMQGWYQHAQLAAQHGKQLVFYEGGQHFTPDPWGTVQPYNLALLEAQVAPEMYDLYQQLLDTIAGLSSEEMQFMHFSFIAPLGDEPEDARWGSFGSLTSQFFESPPYPNAPKYRALVDHIEPCETATTVFEKHLKADFEIYPNPAKNLVQLNFPSATAGQISVFTPNGQLLLSEWMPSSELHLLEVAALPAGIYFLRVQRLDGSYLTQKLLIR